VAFLGNWREKRGLNANDGEQRKSSQEVRSLEAAIETKQRLSLRVNGLVYGTAVTAELWLWRLNEHGEVELASKSGTNAAWRFLFGPLLGSRSSASGTVIGFLAIYCAKIVFPPR
jgi:hypothetical protein